MVPEKSPKVLIFIVAYHAETTLGEVLFRIPAELKNYDVEVLVIDDASADSTFDRGEEVRQQQGISFPITILTNPINQGYGGNQKLGYRYAIENDFDYVALIHGDGQYAPEMLPVLLKPLIDAEADAVFGSRMMETFGALKGGMPLYKYLGNKVLSLFENFMLGTKFSEFHSGYRLYSVNALRSVPFELNTNQFHFDTEIIIQFLNGGFQIKEIPIPTYYGDEICRVNGLRYAWDCIRSVTAAVLQKYNLLYRANFDVAIARDASNRHYSGKLDFDSSHRHAAASITPGQSVIDLGCGPGVLAPCLKEQNCKVLGVDIDPPSPESGQYFDSFVVRNLNDGLLGIDFRAVDRVLLLDVVEHLYRPERFCDELRLAMQRSLDAKCIVTLPNVGFWMVRLMLLFGQLNYGKRGILDHTHTRLFTFSSARRMFSEHGFQVLQQDGIPPPFALALKSRRLAAFLARVNRFLISVSRGFFSYQIFMIVKPLPTVETLLGDTRQHTVLRRTMVSAQPPEPSV